ncbi:MAG: hypothetical protein V5A64_02245, partial [Candidatus Thermoplasmatota archaeon]
FWTKLGLKQTKPSQKETFRYPVLHTYLTYTHRFNQRASKYWGWKYKTADGKIPGESTSFNAVDDGVCEKYYGKPGSHLPDFTISETTPFYCSKAGFENVYSTAYEPVVENLNKGVILWSGIAHGVHNKGGYLHFWDPDSKLVHEKNPWRGYEPYLGSTEEPDTMSMEAYGLIPMLFGNPIGEGLTGRGIFATNWDYAPAKRPLLDFIGRMLSKIPGSEDIFPGITDTQDYYDGVVGSILFGYKFNQEEITGPQIDDDLENLHSAGIVNGACLFSTKYFQLALIRHGSSFQTLDPWPTSWYTSWLNEIPRSIAIGETPAEGFTKGIGHVGILPLTGQWWADNKQNVLYYGDPDLRVYSPNTEYSDANYWTKDETRPLQYDEETNIEGHMPFGATGYPHEREPQPIQPLWILILVVLVVVIAVAAFVIKKKK